MLLLPIVLARRQLKSRAVIRFYLMTMHAQGLAVGADASSQRIIVVFGGEGDEEGKEMALKPENLKL
jgi:hypothetical protein